MALHHHPHRRHHCPPPLCPQRAAIVHHSNVADPCPVPPPSPIHCPWSASNPSFSPFPSAHSLRAGSAHRQSIAGMSRTSFPNRSLLPGCVLQWNGQNTQSNSRRGPSHTNVVPFYHIQSPTAPLRMDGPEMTASDLGTYPPRPAPTETLPSMNYTHIYDSRSRIAYICTICDRQR